ncbi:alpha/beta fold hydrolase [Georgenia sp. Z1491]|uniref:alpha/beta fold hydrolase n=1 Tax=Georgenia sp. Z1491 TaxID=3416707 RepID=UPI003CEB4B89
MTGELHATRTSDLHVTTTGDGPRVVLLHCDAATGSTGWRAQRGLASRWTLVVPDRPGYGRSPRARVDFEAEAPAHAGLLSEGAHLVGHSNGGVAAMHVAALAPHLVRSLTLVEPPAFGVTDAPEAVATRERLIELWEQGPDDPFEFWDRFARTIGERPWPRQPLPTAFEDGVRALMGSRGPWEARPDLVALRAAPFPVLVVSGGHHAGFEAVADTIASATDAERAVLPGRQHMVPLVGEPFDALVDDFWRRTDSAQARDAGAGQAPRASA